MVIAPVIRVEVEEVDSLSDTSRGRGGFGKTGITVNHSEETKHEQA